MSDLSVRLKYREQTGREARVYFTSHPADFSLHFETVVGDIFDKTESVIYYTKDLTAQFPDGERELLLSEMQLFVIPVTLKLLTEKSRAMDVDIQFARKKGIPILPIMMEGGLDALYSAEDKFGELQYISRIETDITAIPYAEKLEKFLSTVVLSKHQEELVRADFSNYVFLSYRKKDRAYANRLMQRIHSDPSLSDVAIWYDEFLTIGESFQKNISGALEKSRALILLVTPSLLEDGNFVMSVEYPAATESGIPIIPIEMMQTDEEQLNLCYPGLPSVVGFESDGLLNGIRAALHTKNDAEQWEARHKYLMGLAYLYGVDVELDRDRGLNLILSAAQDNYYDAMIMLWNYYSDKYVSHKNELWLACSIYLYREEHFGQEHPETLSALREVASIYTSKGEYARAREWLEECYEVSCRTLGEAHPDTVTTLEYIGWTYRNEGEREKSLEIFERVFELRTEVLGIEHFSTVSVITSLLEEYRYFKNHEKTLNLTKLIYELKKSRFGEGHHKTLEKLNLLTVEYRSYARKIGADFSDQIAAMLSDAINLGEREYSRLCNELGEGHPDTLEQLRVLAESYSLSGDSERAVWLYESILPHCATLYGEDSMQVRSIEFSLFSVTEGESQLEKLSKMSTDELSALLFDDIDDI
ncbi:MAG: toll/interleukin-1 receptor domain-containing protein [Clostridia bacterium]|nr:toll/interleukin-1 receptor domain-containing protein [Clostridia bacterium]